MEAVQIKEMLFASAVSQRVTQTCRKAAWTESLSSSENLSRCRQIPESPRSQRQSKSVRKSSQIQF